MCAKLLPRELNSGPCGMTIAPRVYGRPIIILNTKQCFNALNLGLSIVE